MHTTDFTDSNAMTVTRSGSFDLDMTPEAALPLFKAPGEKLWISIWDPVILHGDGYETGTVFVTKNHGHATYWYVADYDTEANHAQYVRVTPDVDTGMVDVSLVPNGTGGSIVHVAYQLTALSAKGNANLRQTFSESQYAQMMEDWRTMINNNREKIDSHFTKGDENECRFVGQES